ncbi:MAG: hypothetical protein LBI43_01995, partial [Streptococcaceae bacterium]|nr:hypothetical protein [Streptococcaceae bacterium]
ATLTQAGTCFTSLYLPPWTSRPSKQKQTGLCGSTWRGLRRSEGRLLVRSAPYSAARRVIRADSPTQVSEIDTPFMLLENQAPKWASFVL